MYFSHSEFHILQHQFQKSSLCSKCCGFMRKDTGSPSPKALTLGQLHLFNTLCLGLAELIQDLLFGAQNAQQRRFFRAVRILWFLALKASIKF
uniref:Uncharacterized protein n=1 Tax=Anguilla anguilla TaxID=7936 RepID=A0A0E9X6R7_ANGAN